MTPKEAIDFYNQFLIIRPANPYQDAAKLSIQALEKQIPKRPDFEGDGYDENGMIILDTWICPCCEEKYETEYEEYKRCPNCGQAIDWRDTE